MLLTLTSAWFIVTGRQYNEANVYACLHLRVWSCQQKLTRQYQWYFVPSPPANLPQSDHRTGLTHLSLHIQKSGRDVQRQSDHPRPATRGSISSPR